MISNFKKTIASSTRKLGLIALAALSAMMMAGFASFHTVQADENNLPVDAAPLNIPISPIQRIEGDANGETAAPADKPAQPDAGLSVPAAKPILRILFDADDATLSDEARAEVSAFVADFKAKGGRVTLKGYAGVPGSTSSNDRRLSLRRVLAVREAILEAGIQPERLEVRALGGANDAGPQDRVDILKPGR